MSDSPPLSPLSSHASSEFTDDIKTEPNDQTPEPSHMGHLPPPSKKQRTGQTSYRVAPYTNNIPVIPPEEEDNISSDTSGDIPASPGPPLPQMQEDEATSHEQVTVCKWSECPVGDVGNMDVLVQHIHDEHIGTRQKKYACEWEDCTRKGMNHASGYALRAHMRSHTREKPFYCALPECDRSFTRSDALAKHMRTVHETEALRPSDPIPRNHSAAQKPQRLKLIVHPKSAGADPHTRNGSPSAADADDDATIDSAPSELDSDIPPPHPFEYPPEIQFTDEELSMPSDRLYQLLRRQIHWAHEEQEELKSEVEHLEKKRKEEWQAKELVLANVMEAELAKASLKFDNLGAFQEDLPNPWLPLEGETVPWYRVPHEGFEEGMG